ncbi:unnamed protein product [Rotaria magnacalcarata]
MLTKKILFASFKDVKRPPHGTKLRWKDKVMKDITVVNIKNWRRETYDKDTWRKTINRGVAYGIVHTDATRVVREHKERAAERRAQEELMNHTPKKTTTDDITCKQCGRICKNIKGLKIHHHTCIYKNITDKKVVTQKIRQSISTLSHWTTTSRPIKIIELLLKNNNNEYICPNQTCGRALKARGATSHSRDVTIPILPIPIPFGIGGTGIGGYWYWWVLVLVGIGIGGYWHWSVLVLVGIGIGGYWYWYWYWYW